jgi:hypothetical protein
VAAEAVAGDEYLAVLLFVKNPTVIALTVIWLIGLVRQAVTSDFDTRSQTVGR